MAGSSKSHLVIPMLASHAQQSPPSESVHLESSPVAHSGSSGGVGGVGGVGGGGGGGGGSGGSGGVGGAGGGPGHSGAKHE